MKHVATFALTFLLLSTPSGAQDQDIFTGGFQTRGAVTAGYRFTDVAGRRQKYNEFFNLRGGFRVHDLELFGISSQPPGDRFADSFSLTLSGLGGEPFAGGQLRVGRTGRYDLRASYRQSHYYWDRNDEATHPTGLFGLTANRDWATVRKTGSVGLSLHATEKLRFSFEYYRTGRDGLQGATRTLDYFGAPAAWAAFLRANPYRLEVPIQEIANRFSGGVSYSLQNWNLMYRTGYQTYEENIRADNLQPGQRSINVGDAATADELLQRASWLEFRRLRTPLSEIFYNGRPADRLWLRGGYILYRYRGPVRLNASFNGVARTNTAGTAFAPFAVSLTNDGEVSETSHVIDQGVSYRLRDWWNWHADYRYSRFDQDARGLFHALRDGVTPTAGESGIEWERGLHTFETSFEFLPIRSVVIRPGIRLMNRDVTATHDGVEDPQTTRRSNIVWPVASASYTPSARFSVRGEFQSITNDAPYTRISPRTDLRSRMILRYQPREDLSVHNNLSVRTSRFRTNDFRSSYRSNSTSITYALSEQLALLGAFTYDSFFAATSVTFLRGTPPLTAIWRDQTISRVWQAGIDARPVPRLNLRLTGNYVRTTGAGEISGEPPVFGPLRWPMVSGTMEYDFGPAGRMAIDLHRTYYIEELFRGDNFGANLLGIRWTRDFGEPR